MRAYALETCPFCDFGGSWLHVFVEPPELHREGTVTQAQRVLARFLEACPAEWAAAHVHAVTVGLLARINIAQISRDADELHRLSAAIRAHLREDGVRLLFSGAGNVRSYALYRSLTMDQERQYLDSPFHYPAYEAAQGQSRTWIIDFRCPYGIEWQLIRELAALLPPSIRRACYKRRVQDRPVVRELEIARLRPANLATKGGQHFAQGGTTISPPHAILDISNLTQLFEDDLVSPEELFNELRFNCNLGDLLMLLLRKKWAPEAPPYEPFESINLKVRIRQFYIHHSPAGQALAAITWAWVSPRTLKRLTQHPQRPLGPFELNDGRMLLLEGAGPASQDPQPLFDCLRQGPFAGIDELYFRSAGTVHRISLSDAEALKRAWVATATPVDNSLSGGDGRSALSHG